MKVTLTDVDSRQVVIDSKDPVTVGRWLGEHVGRLATNVPALMASCKIQVIPETRDEMEFLHHAGDRQFNLDAEGLVSLYEPLKKYAEILLEREINGPTA